MKVWIQKLRKLDKGQEPAVVIADYDTYQMSLREKAVYTAAAAAIIYLTGYVFYRSHIFSMILCFLGLLYPRYKTKDLVARRKKELNLQFKDMLYSLSSSLSAGKSVESAFREVLKDLQILYPDTETHIIKEVGYIVKQIDMNEPIESSLEAFAARSKLEDVVNFAEVFHTCKRTGGNLVEVIRNTSDIINDKIEIKQDIDTLLAQRTFERKVLNVLPILMVVILSTSAGDYIAPVFHTISGRIAMSVSIFFIAAAYFISKKIMDINI